jgi:hypothetical protein
MLLKKNRGQGHKNSREEEALLMKGKITRRKFMTHMLLMSALGSYGCRNGFLADSRSDSTLFPKPASTPDTFENHMQLLEEVEFLFDHIKLSTIAKITGINSYEFPYDSFQVSVECKSFENNITLEFFPDNVCHRDRIIQDLNIGSIYFIKGDWSVFSDGSITLYGPDYQRMAPGHLEDQMKKVFEMS